MLIVTIPFEDKSHMLMDFLTSGKEALLYFGTFLSKILPPPLASLIVLSVFYSCSGFLDISENIAITCHHEINSWALVDFWFNVFSLLLMQKHKTLKFKASQNRKKKWIPVKAC